MKWLRQLLRLPPPRRSLDSPFAAQAALVEIGLRVIEIMDPKGPLFEEALELAKQKDEILARIPVNVDEYARCRPELERDVQALERRLYALRKRSPKRPPA